MNFHLDNISFSYKSKAFPPRQVFSHLSLTIGSGECIAIVGEEGTGKSTLLQLLNGLQKPDLGRVLVDGRNIWEDSKRLHQVRRGIGFAFQFPEQQFFCETVEDELLFAARNFGAMNSESEQCCSSAIVELGLDESYRSRSPFSLSMGEARRVALASLLVHQPEGFLLDEPTAGLDAFGFDVVKSLIMRLKSQGKTIVIVSHDVELVSAVALRVIVLAEGNVQSDQQIAEFLTDAITAST
ncbi:MAG: ABC transporter ATP-binding protein [Bacteroidota bacterium]